MDKQIDLNQVLLDHSVINEQKENLIKDVFRGKYFPLSANKHHGIVLEFRAFSEKF